MFSIPKIAKPKESPEKAKLKRAVKEILKELGLSSFYHSVVVYIDTKISDEQAKRIIKTVLEVLGDDRQRKDGRNRAKGR